ncbi:hypothetical protein OQA88_6601 [Cercophora sp. LCS_1]
MSSPSSALDDEIAALQSRVLQLKSRLLTQTTTLLSSPTTHSLLTSSPSHKALLARYTDQQAHKQQNLYRTCTGLTTFRARDPDPNAADGGAILGLRIEIVSRAKFLLPHYVLLNRPSPSHKGYLKVHRHTVPAGVPLAGLSARYLPPPSKEEDGEGKKQDVAKFARALRRELVRYHHRMGVIADLRKAVGLGEGGRGPVGGEDGIVDLRGADAENKQVTIDWASGRTGRLVMGDDGEILKVVAVEESARSGEIVRDRELVRELVGGAERVQDMVKKLAGV